MKLMKRLTALAVTVAMLMTLLPISAMAADSNEYSIANEYITYTYNAATGGFSITTLEGHPQKDLDNNIPLLYTEDAARSNGTSFATIRAIYTNKAGKEVARDFVFGQDYGWFGINTTLSQPVVSEQGRLITTRWSVNMDGLSFTAIQRVALSLDENNDRTGNVAIEYELINNGSTPVKLGARLLLDVALDAYNDAPYVLTGSFAPDSYTEMAYVDDNVPTQIRFMDSLSSSQKMAYTILNDGDTKPDKVIIGHWANLANTRYDYEPDPYFDYLSAANNQRTSDTAAAYYWEPESLTAGGSRTTEILYGVGNFGSSSTEEKLAISMTTGEVELTADKKSYKNDGVFQVTVNFVNLDHDGFSPSTYTISLEDGLTFADDGKKEKSSSLIPNSEGIIEPLSFTVKAAPQFQLTSKRIVVSATGYTDSAAASESGASRSILLPAINGALPDVQMNAVTPERVYYAGQKSVTVTGEMKALSALEGSDNWDLYLVPAGKTDISFKEGNWVRIEKKDIAFTDKDAQNTADQYKTLTFSTSKELTVGSYKVMFEFRNNLVQSYGVSRLYAGSDLLVTADPKDALRIYGIAALVRYNTTGNADATNTAYDFFQFSDEGQLKTFMAGGSATSINGNTITFDKDSDKYDVLAIVKGQLRLMEKEGGAKYLQADPSESDVTINNILVYCGEEPLVLEKVGKEASIHANGLLKVINSITVWRYSWNITATDGKVFSLADTGDSDDSAVAATTTASALRVSLGGAASMIQSIGGMAIKLEYGVLTESVIETGQNAGTYYGINFGGKASLPIKAKSAAEEANEGSTNQGSTNTENTNTGNTTGPVSDGTTENGKLTAEINNVLFGQDSGSKEIGFLGIDATLIASLPQDVLGSFISSAPGVEVEVRINTIDNIYRFNVGVEMAVIQCEATVGFKQVPINSSEKLMLDEVQFGLGTEAGVPLIYPFLSMNYLGGGFSGLADSVSDDFEGIPPITIHATLGLLLVNVFEGRFEAYVNAYGMGLAGELTIANAPEWLGKINGSIEAKWLEEFYISAYGQCNFLDGVIKGGITILIRDDYFYGYIYAAVHLPKSIPLVGGMELGRVEAAVSTRFIGANLKVLGIRMGLIYYWDGELIVGKGVDISSRANVSGLLENTFIDEDGKPQTYYIDYGTNLRRLTTEDSVATRAGQSVTKSFNPVGEDALLFEVPLYESEEGAIRDLSSDNIILTGPNNTQIEMVEATEENDYEGSYFIQERKAWVDGSGEIATEPDGIQTADEMTGESSYYLYITVTEQTKLLAGDWTLTITDENVSTDNFSVDAVDALPDINSVTYTHSGDTLTKINWTAEKETSAAGTVRYYLTADADAASALRNEISIDENLLIGIGQQEYTSIALSNTADNITLPTELASDTYYLVAMLELAQGGISVAVNETPFVYTNSKEPEPVEAVTLSYGGNEALLVNVTDPANADYTDYIVTVSSGGSTITETMYPKGAEILIGEYLEAANTTTTNDEGKAIGTAPVATKKTLTPNTAYTVAVQTVKQTDEGIFYGQTSVKSNSFTLLAAQYAQVEEESTNIVTTEKGTMSTGAINMELTFDKPVYFAWTLDDGGMTYSSEAAAKWSIAQTVADGGHILSWSAMTASGDVIKEDYAFEIDTQAPVLSLSKSETESVATTQAVTVNAEVGNQTVFADAGGSFTLTGLTEPKATLTLAGTSGGINVDANGVFSITRTLTSDQQNSQVTTFELKAVDKAGNETVLYVNVLNAALSAIEGIEVLFDAIAATRGEDDTVKSITLSPGQSMELSALGLANSRNVTLADGAVVYTIHGSDEAVAISGGRLIALKGGTATLKAAYAVAAVDVDGRMVNAEITELVTIEVKDPGYSFTLLHTANYTIFTMTPKTPDGNKRTVIIDGTSTEMLYDAVSETYICAFKGTVTFSAIKGGLSDSDGTTALILIAGDYDKDGQVQQGDVTNIVDWFLNKTAWDDTDSNRVVRIDINGDGVVDVLDALLAAKKVVTP